MFKQTPNVSKKKRTKIRFIILHSTGYSGLGQYDGAVSWLCNPASKVSAHYVISREGDITQLAQCIDITWHAGVSSWGKYKNLNALSVGIEMEHSDKNNDDWPDEQLRAVASVVRTVMKKFDIPFENVLGHNQIAPGRKVDPKNFPFDKLKKLVNQ